MTLFNRLDVLDRKRETLHIYETRLRRLFFATRLRDRQLARIARTWKILSDERAHILALINANPVLREQLFEREAVRKASTVPVPTPLELVQAAQDLAALYAREREAKQAFHDATIYAKWADDGDPISKTERHAIRDRFLMAFRLVQSDRLSRQKTFETTLSRLYTDPTRCIAERERLMEAALKSAGVVAAQAPAQPNAFAAWRQLRLDQLQAAPTAEPRRQRAKSRTR